MTDRPVLYDFKDQCALLKDFGETILALIDERICMAGETYRGDTDLLPTSRDNYKGTGYIAFHEGCIESFLFANGYALEALGDILPKRVVDDIDSVREHLWHESIEQTCQEYNDGVYQSLTREEGQRLYNRMLQMEAIWLRDSENTRERPEKYYEAHKWIQTCDEAYVNRENENLIMYAVKMTSFLQEFDADDFESLEEGVGILRARLSINIDAPYYRESIAELPIGQRQKEFDLWETALTYSGTEVTEDLLQKWTSEIGKSLKLSLS